MIDDIISRLLELAKPGTSLEDVGGVSVFTEAASEIARLRLAIRRLADQDATLSVVGGNVIVEMDATLTDAEREAIERGYCSLMGVEDMSAECTRWDAEAAATLRGLLERMG